MYTIHEGSTRIKNLNYSKLIKIYTFEKKERNEAKKY